MAVAIIVFLAAFLWRSAESPSSNTKDSVGSSNDFSQAQRLKGKWVRPDGGYTLVIEDVTPDGRLKASYFNPRKINVFLAKWEIEDDYLKLFVELRDTNYPGSKYTLVYTKQQDSLSGEYFQALQKQTFDVQFTRMLEAYVK